MIGYQNALKRRHSINIMAAVLSLFLFFGGMAFCVLLIGRVCYEGDYDDFD